MGRPADQVTALVFEIAQLLDTKLSFEAVQAITELIDDEVNPEALAAAIKQVRKQSARRAAATATAAPQAGSGTSS